LAAEWFLGSHGNYILQAQDFTDFFYSFAAMLSHNQCSIWCLLLWSIWNSHNQNLPKETTENGAVFSDGTSKFLQQWHVPNQLAERPDNGSLQPVQSRWTKPPARTLKCNVDAAFVEEGVGFGMRLGDNKSRFIQGKIIRRIASKLSVPDAERYALYHVIRWLKDLNAKNVVFELYDLFQQAGFYYPKLIFFFFFKLHCQVFETLPSFIHDAIVNEMT
jgi:hypothetical protein